MWRPFISRFTDKTYDNFIKKQSRLSTAPPKNYNPPKTNQSFTYPRSFSSDNTIRLEEYKNLQEKVKNQRRSIKLLEKTQERKKGFEFFGLKRLQEEEKQKKIMEIEKIRSFSNNKARRAQPLKLNTKHSMEEFCEKEFFLNDFKPKVLKKSTMRPVIKKSKTKNRETLKEAQDRMMKDLKVTAPSYYKELKQEFMKIREHCEMTFEHYTESRRLKRNNPYEQVLKKKRM